MLQIVYSFFVGILLVLFVGFGIATFYEAPVSPTYPETTVQTKEPTEEQLQADKKFQAEQKVYEEKMKTYNRNVSVAALIAAIIFLTVGLVFEHKIKVLSDGILLGGIFTLLYSMGRGFASGDSKYSFMMVTVGLIIALTLGYLKFVKEHLNETTKTNQKAKA